MTRRPTWSAWTVAGATALVITASVNARAEEDIGPVAVRGGTEGVSVRDFVGAIEERPFWLALSTLHFSWVPATREMEIRTRSAGGEVGALVGRLWLGQYCGSFRFTRNADDGSLAIIDSLIRAGFVPSANTYTLEQKPYCDVSFTGPTTTTRDPERYKLMFHGPQANDGRVAAGSLACYAWQAGKGLAEVTVTSPLTSERVATVRYEAPLPGSTDQALQITGTLVQGRLRAPRLSEVVTASIRRTR